MEDRRGRSRWRQSEREEGEGDIRKGERKGGKGRSSRQCQCPCACQCPCTGPVPCPGPGPCPRKCSSPHLLYMFYVGSIKRNKVTAFLY